MIVEYYEDVIILSGELRFNFWETVRTTLTLLLKRHPSGVIIDCSGISAMTAEGADTFKDMMGYVRDHEGARIIVAAAPANVLEVLRQVPEVRSQLPAVASVEDARRSLDLLVAEGKKDKRRREVPVASDRRLVACLTGFESDDDVLRVTMELVRAHPARVCLAFPILVPRELPIQSPMPGIEDRALAAIDKAKEALVKHGVVAEVRLERTRDMSALLDDISEEMQATYVIVSSPPRKNEADDASAAAINLLRSVLHRVKRPVLFVRPAVKD